MASSSKSAVLGALLGNGLLTLVKLGAFVLSGSGAMFSEAKLGQRFPRLKYVDLEAD